MVSEGPMAKNIQELRGLMSRKPIGRESGTIGGRIPRQLIFGGNQMPDTQIIIGRIREESGGVIYMVAERRREFRKIITDERRTKKSGL